MQKEHLESFIEAGKILSEIRKDLLKKLEPGIKILDIANFVDHEIEKRGAKPAFPVNISIDDWTAHYTPIYNDERKIEKGELVKIDIGVRINGYIADSAITYCSEKSNIIDVNKEALDEALKLVRPGLRVCEIGNKIEAYVKSKGLGLIVNLTGHGIGYNEFHRPPIVMNIKNNNNYVLQENEVIAIEPFVCEGGGYVKDSGIKEIYRYLQDRPIRSDYNREILKHIKENFSFFPFAKRWLCEKFSPVKVSLALRELERVGALKSYPLLKEQNRKKVSQFEYTIIVQDDPIVTTPIL